jgi:NAD(P)-dependent dehydrogenase (short-subunit alcohol dehydrogenase family)
MQRLNGRRILVTGAASGIGLAIVELFLQEGASVLAIDRAPQPLDAMQGRLGDVARNCVVAAPTDVTLPDQVRDAVARGVERFGGLDGVVNAAGIDLLRPFGEMSMDEWNRVIGVNLTGPAVVCQAALAALRKAGKGSIVNIASGAGLRPLDKRSAYCASKAGVIMFTKALALELAGDGIRANVICPGVIDTPMFRASYEDEAAPQAALDKIMERFAIRRVGTPMDIALAALYLTSDESAYVTGSALAVDAGRAFH